MGILSIRRPSSSRRLITLTRFDSHRDTTYSPAITNVALDLSVIHLRKKFIYCAMWKIYLKNIFTVRYIYVNISSKHRYRNVRRRLVRGTRRGLSAIYSSTREFTSGSATTLPTREQKDLERRSRPRRVESQRRIVKEISNRRTRTSPSSPPRVAAVAPCEIRRNRICNAIALALYSDSIINPPCAERWIRSCYAISDPRGPARGVLSRLPFARTILAN